jgi:FkbM family methyltransferase
MSELRTPSCDNSITLFSKMAPEACSTVIDVGVQYWTPFLMKALPDSFHHLFEPVDLYYEHIQKAYSEKGIEFALHRLALGKADGTAFLYKFANDSSGRVTHAQISDRPDERFENTVDVSSIPTRSLDSMASELNLNKHTYLVKMDVDGIEEEIINGGRGFLSNASLIIIEASLIRRNVISRAQLLESIGFRLWDICGNAYYFGQLSQVDLVFINEEFRGQNLDFQPWKKTRGLVDWDNWQSNF